MAPLIKARPGFGQRLVAPFAFEAAHSETIYLVSRTEQARDRRMPRYGDGSPTPSVARVNAAPQGGVDERTEPNRLPSVILPPHPIPLELS